jgi:hypothetical protein
LPGFENHNLLKNNDLILRTSDSARPQEQRKESGKGRKKPKNGPGDIFEVRKKIRQAAPFLGLQA